MSFRVVAFLLPFLVWVAGCDEAFERSEDEIPVDARPIISELRQMMHQGDASLLSHAWPDDVEISNLPQILEQISVQVLGEGEPEKSALILLETGTESDREDVVEWVKVSYALTWPDRRVRTDYEVARTPDGDWRVFRINALLVDANPIAPDWPDWGVTRSVFATLGIAVPLFIIATLIIQLRTPKLKRRILWSAVILIGCFPVFEMNWSTGAWWLEAPAITRTDTSINLKFLSFKLLGASILKQGYFGAWTIGVCVPLGALWFWVRKLSGGLRLKQETVPR